MGAKAGSFEGGNENSFPKPTENLPLEHELMSSEEETYCLVAVRFINLENIPVPYYGM
jgi:hypothetical protein